MKPSETVAAGTLTPPLIGRARELERFDAALESAAAGHGRLLLLAGEPGMGKTRLAEAVCERARARGMLPLWGRSSESGGAPSYWPWAQILRDLVDARGRERLESALVDAAPWLARILPELRGSSAGETDPQAPRTDKARFALFDGISSLLRSVAAEDPLVIFIDDIHAADQPSLLLFEFVAELIADTRIVLLGAYQEAAAHQRPEVRNLIGTLRPDGSTIVLSGFGEEELREVVEQHAGRQWPPELLRALRDTTEGNPFFAHEVVKLVAAEEVADGRREGQRERFPLPDTVRDAVRQRFAPLTPAAFDVLELAAVIGREFGLGTLERATGRPASELLQAVDQASAAGLVVAVPEAIGTFRFTHNLVRETLYAGLTRVDRVRLHRAVGEALEHSYGGAPERLAELAHHFAEAATGGEAEKALDYAIRAAEEAMRVLAYEHAGELYELALELGELLPPDARRRAELLLALGRARERAPDMDSRETLIAAADAARPLDDPRLFVDAALEMWAFPLGYGVLDSQPSALLTEALERLGDRDDALRARVLARLALSLYYWPGTEERRSALVDEAVAIARRLGDPATLSYVLGNAQLATSGPDSTERDLAWIRELLELTEENIDEWLVRHARNWEIDLLLELDQVTAADAKLRALELEASGGASPRVEAYVKLHRARQAGLEGNFGDACRLNAEAAAEGARLRDSAVVTLARAQAFVLWWDQGRLDELAAAIRETTSKDATPAWPAGLALMCCEIGQPAEAKRHFERLATGDFRDLPRYNGWSITLALLAEVCVRLDDKRRAAKLYELLAPFESRNVVVAQSVFAGPVVRYLGILAACRGEWSLAQAHFDAARAAARRINARPVELRIDVDEAAMLAKRGEPGDRERALELLDDAAGIATEVGVDRVAERIEEQRATIAGDSPQAAAAPAPPSARGASLVREGDIWTFSDDDGSVRLKDSRGVHCLALLLSNPGVEIHAMALARPGSESGANGRARAAAADAELEGETFDDAGPVLDQQAKTAYRRRLAELREEVEEAESFNDPERLARAREEMEFIESELAGGVGLGGRDRRAASSSERARISVTKAIRGTIRRIGEHHSALGSSLDANVRTGTFCVYEPDPRHPLTWRVDTG